MQIYKDQFQNDKLTNNTKSCINDYKICKIWNATVYGNLKLEDD